jgi:hypothetical protein
MKTLSPELYEQVKLRLAAHLPGAKNDAFAVDREAAEAAVKEIYRCVGYPEPVVFWAGNPVHLQMMPLLLQGLLLEAQKGAPLKFLERFGGKLMLRWNLPTRLKGEWLGAYSCLLAQLTPQIEAAMRPVGHGRPNNLLFPMDESYSQRYCGSALGVPAVEGMAWFLAATKHEAHRVMQDRLVGWDKLQVETLNAVHVENRHWQARLALSVYLRRKFGAYADVILRLDGPPQRLPVSKQHLIDDLERYLPKKLFSYLTELHDIECHHSYVDGTSALTRPERQDNSGCTGGYRLNEELGCELYTPIWSAWTEDEISMLGILCEVYGDDLFGPDLTQKLRCLYAVKHSALCHIFTSRAVFACRKPVSVSFDEHARVHRLDGPAIEFEDGMGVYCWSGVNLSEEKFLLHSHLCVEDMQREENAELRRVLIERYGEARFVQDAGAEEIHRDDFGRLLRKQLNNDEDIVMLCVTNATAESDGTFKEYFLRVPPHLTTARAAAAWTFGLDEKEYAPEVET